MARDSNCAIAIEELLAAYRLGYFPMARSHDDDKIVWVLPEERGVLPLGEARAPRSLLKIVRRAPFEIRIDTAFREVILACAQQTPNRPDTWINDAIVETYCELHWKGLAHSVECWRDGRLVGGLYGLPIGAAFCGESMFSREANASKVAFVHLLAHLIEAGFDFVDAQFWNDHLEQFGLKAIANDDYQSMLSAARERLPRFPRPRDQLSTARVSQLITHTS